MDIVVGKKSSRESTYFVSMPCKCGRLVDKVSSDAVAVTCWRCVHKLLPNDELNEHVIELKKTYPRGWRTQELFVDLEGNVYKKGERMRELKGKYPATPYTPKDPSLKVERKERKKRKTFKEKVEEVMQKQKDFSEGKIDIK